MLKEHRSSTARIKIYYKKIKLSICHIIIIDGALARHTLKNAKKNIERTLERSCFNAVSPALERRSFQRAIAQHDNSKNFLIASKYN
ncbi:hypothetical protein BpHYR1_027662 [Brachionus plicatilis]|uniref:Uncharacterized protein n=1 Tax=Brachionus plicatilis TaxID=10195 RepID=A0A3M7S3W0_BRAPC|nr:hypothetical protein BpHYR1_027662 [Brachionus plicatilis]